MDWCNNEVQEPLLEQLPAEIPEDTVNHSTAMDIGKPNEQLLEMTLNQLPAPEQAISHSMAMDSKLEKTTA